MGKFVDITGNIYGNWKVIELVNKGTGTYTIYKCKCLLCGKEYNVSASSLKAGRSTKCRACGIKISHLKEFHGDPIKIVFKGMKQRCYNKKSSHYKYYGGKGITICDKWLNNPILFYKWAYNNGYKKGMSIERKRLDRGYSPNNCMFIPMEDQSKNRSISHMITINNETKCLADWCRIYNISAPTVMHRYKKGMTFYEALTTPIDKSKYHPKNG